MILDKLNLFSEAQAITATAVSTNVIDLGSNGVASGTNLQISGHVVESFNNLTSLTTTLETSATENFASSRTIATGVQKLLANSGELVAGDTLNLGMLPPGTLRYVRLRYTVAGTAPTTGKITAGLIAGRR